MLTVTGAPEGSEVSVYSLNGQQVGSAWASAEVTRIGTTLHSGEVGIVKIGDKAVKVLVK